MNYQPHIVYGDGGKYLKTKKQCIQWIATQQILVTTQGEPGDYHHLMAKTSNS